MFGSNYALGFGVLFALSTFAACLANILFFKFRLLSVSLFLSLFSRLTLSKLKKRKNGAVPECVVQGLELLERHEELAILRVIRGAKVGAQLRRPATAPVGEVACSRSKNRCALEL